MNATHKAAQDKEPADKIRLTVAELAEFIARHAVPQPAAMTILSDALRALKRADKRAETLPEDWQRVEIAQSRGPLLEFTGRKLADHTFQPAARVATDITLELWETQGGAYIAATFTEPEGSRAIVSATVVPPGTEEQARRYACMDQWEWTDRARTMVRKLGWSLREDVA